jgi:hypothetical protein
MMERNMRYKSIKSFLLLLVTICFLPVFGTGDMTVNIRLLRIFQGEEDWYRLGKTIDTLGDINRDGYADFAIGVPGSDDGRGRVDIYFGHPDPDFLKKRTINGSEVTVHFGYKLKNVGDINYDGITDLLIASENATGNYEIVHIYTGNDTGWFDYAKSYYGKEKYDGFGSEVGAGDFNGDGYSDFIIGVPNYDRQRGKVYIYLGGDTIPDNPYMTIQGDSAFAYFAGSVAGVGDVNNDGYDDFVVGGPLGDPDGIVNAGYFKFYYGGSEIDTIPDIELSGYRMYGGMGSTFCSGYFNGDTIRDFIVGSDGEAFMYFGSKDLDSIPDLVFGNPEVLSYAGDINNDGYDDFLSGKPFFGWSNGLVDIYRGSQNFDTLYDYRIHGQWASYFSWTLSAAGDVNGDGLDDFLVGEPRYLLWIDNKGRVYLYSGDSTLVGIDDFDRDLLQPQKFSLQGNYPNPFNPVTTIAYELPKESSVKICIYNLAGQLVQELLNEVKPAGYHMIQWNATNQSSGVYFYRIQAGEFRDIKKCVLLK